MASNQPSSRAVMAASECIGPAAVSIVTCFTPGAQRRKRVLPSSSSCAPKGIAWRCFISALTCSAGCAAGPVRIVPRARRAPGRASRPPLLEQDERAALDVVLGPGIEHPAYRQPILECGVEQRAPLRATVIGQLERERFVMRVEQHQEIPA